MKLLVRTHQLDLPREQQQLIRHRLHLAFARISPWVREVEVTLADINGPRGGEDKRCRMLIRGRSIGTLMIEHVGCDALIAIGEAAMRAEQALLRRIGRRREFASTSAP